MDQKPVIPVTLPSGAEMKVNLAPFATSNGLFKALLKEFQNVFADAQLTRETGVEFFKNIMAKALSSEECEKWMWACLARCTYKVGEGAEVKIDPSVFEHPDHRQDFVPACVQCAVENVLPFLKGLLQGSENLTEKLVSLIPK